MFFISSSKKRKEQKAPSDINNVVISKDGIVSLNLKNKTVQNKILLEVSKLKKFEAQLTSS